MDSQHPAGHRLGHDQLGAGQGDAGVGGPDIGFGIGRGNRAQKLPALGGSVGGVLGQHAVHDGGAGAGRADHKDGLVDGLVEGAGVGGQIVVYLDADF